MQGYTLYMNWNEPVWLTARERERQRGKEDCGNECMHTGRQTDKLCPFLSAGSQRKLEFGGRRPQRMDDHENDRSWYNKWVWRWGGSEERRGKEENNWVVNRLRRGGEEEWTKQGLGGLIKPYRIITPGAWLNMGPCVNGWQSHYASYLTEPREAKCCTEWMYLQGIGNCCLLKVTSLVASSFCRSRAEDIDLTSYLLTQSEFYRVKFPSSQNVILVNNAVLFNSPKVEQFLPKSNTGNWPPCLCGLHLSFNS